MKIAVVSDDEESVSRHFGRAEKYVVFSTEHGRVTDRETLPKPGRCHADARVKHRSRQAAKNEGHGLGRRAGRKHLNMLENIKGCDVLLTRGMGQGAYLDLRQQGVQPIVTDIADVNTAIRALLDDTIINLTEKLH